MKRDEDSRYLLGWAELLEHQIKEAGKVIRRLSGELTVTRIALKAGTAWVPLPEVKLPDPIFHVRPIRAFRYRQDLPGESPLGHFVGYWDGKEYVAEAGSVPSDFLQPWRQAEVWADPPEKNNS